MLNETWMSVEGEKSERVERTRELEALVRGLGQTRMPGICRPRSATSPPAQTHAATREQDAASMLQVVVYSALKVYLMYCN